MRRSGYDRADLAAIAVGGALGAAARWTVSSIPSDQADGGWFVYAPNSSFTTGTNISGFEPVGSDQSIALASGIPIDTLTVNLVGCLLLGALTLLLTRPTQAPRRALVGAATGFCGSLTTFSTFAVEIASMLRAKPVLSSGPAGLHARIGPDISGIALYLLVSVVGGGLVFWLGRSVAKRVLDVRVVSRIGEST